jgi:hypothetical protein
MASARGYVEVQRMIRTASAVALIIEGRRGEPLR